MRAVISLSRPAAVLTLSEGVLVPGDVPLELSEADFADCQRIEREYEDLQRRLDRVVDDHAATLARR